MADRRGDAELAGPLGGLGRVGRVVVDPAGPPLAEHVLGDAVALERDRRADRERRRRTVPWTATTLGAPLAVVRQIVQSAPSSAAASSATFAKISAGGASLATSVATRRSAACSLERSSARSSDSVFAIAVPIRSVNSVTRASVSAGSGARRGCP